MSCGCPTGRDPAVCKHSFALLYALEDYSKQKLYSAPTEKLQTWHQPRPAKNLPKTCSEVFGRQESRDVAVGQLGFNWSCLSNNLPLMRVLKNAEAIQYDLSVPLPYMPLPSGPLYGNLPEDLEVLEILFLHKNLVFDTEAIIQLECTTMEQGEIWKDARRPRLTASNFHRVLTRQANFEELAKSIAKPHDISNLPAVKYGKKYEGWVRNVMRDRFPQYVLRETGLVSHPNYPFLGASPDGLFFNKEKEPMILEIECIFNPANENLGSLVEKRKGFCLKKNGQAFELRESHAYYAQIQGQLALCNVKQCLFVVMYAKSIDNIFTQVIPFNKCYWEKAHPVLKSFYFTFYLKHLVQR